MIFSYYSADYKGNFITSLEMLEKKVNENGGKVIYVFPESAKNAPWMKELENTYFLNGSLLKNVRIVKKLIKQYKINIVHTHFSVVKYDIVFKLARLTGSTYKYVRHMHMIYKNKSNAVMEKIKRFISNGDAEIACSVFAAEEMGKCGFKNIITVNNAIDFRRFENITAAGNNNILMMGYDCYTKGVDLAIQAAEKIKDDIKLQICVASKLDNLKHDIIEIFGKLPEFVEFLPPVDNVGKYYANTDIFLSASRQESYCFAIREAGYCGCKMIGSDIPAHRVSGALLFKNGNADDLKRVLEYALKEFEPDREKQKEEIGKSCSLESWSNEIYNVYEKIANNR